MRVQILYGIVSLATPEVQFVSHLIEKKVIPMISHHRGPKLSVWLENNSRRGGP